MIKIIVWIKIYCEGDLKADLTVNDFQGMNSAYSETVLTLIFVIELFASKAYHELNLSVVLSSNV